MKSRSFRERSTADAGSPQHKKASSRISALAPFLYSTRSLATWIDNPSP